MGRCSPSFEKSHRKHATGMGVLITDEGQGTEFHSRVTLQQDMVEHEKNWRKHTVLGI